MGLLELLEALKAVERQKLEELQNYGDIAALLRSNPFLAACATWVVIFTSKSVMDELEKRLPSPDLDLLDYQDVARIMKKTVSAVRQMKARGYLKAVKHNIRGKAYFTKESVMTAIKEMEERESAAMEARKKNMSAVRIVKKKKVA